MPPPMARAIASEILQATDAKPERPKGAMPLGPLPLLMMGMAEAARHFGIPVPIGNRDRKSGSRKRTQLEVEAELKRAVS